MLAASSWRAGKTCEYVSRVMLYGGSMAEVLHGKEGQVLGKVLGILPDEREQSLRGIDARVTRAPNNVSCIGF